MAKQIYNKELGEFDNPAILPLIDKVLPDMKPILIGKNYGTRMEWELYQLADEANKYIGDKRKSCGVVSSQLTNNHNTSSMSLIILFIFLFSDFSLSNLLQLCDTAV